MIKRSIRRRIVAIAVGLIVLMVTTSILSIVMVGRVGHLLDELTDRYIPANTHLTRINILSLERALALRRMVIAKMQDPPDELGYKTRKQLYEAKDAEVDTEADAAHKLISAVIDDTSTPSDNTALARIDSRIDSLVGEFRHHLRQESGELLAALDARDFAAARRSLGRTDTLRDEYTEKVEAIRAEMLKVSYGAVATIRSEQTRAVQTSAIVTALAAIVGLIFANLVSGGIIRSVRKLLDGTRAVEAGHLEQSIDVRTTDEIGQLAAAFNRMVQQLRTNQRVRETFGKYVDPRVVEGLIERPNLTAAEGQRRVMTVLFCDLRGFTSLGEGMTPQGLVKVMNRYLSIMSEPIRTNRGIIDKYIGDGIMAYWGPPFVDDADHALFACLAAVEMIDRIATLRREIPELLGVLGTPMETCDLRIGIATGEALVGSIGSDVMMSYTVMGDVVNFASRLEGANKVYGTRNLASERTIAAAAAALEVREIDRVVVAGHTRFEVVFEILGSKGKLLPQQLALRDSYLEGLAAYREQRWDDALAKFGAALEGMPGDGPSITMLKRTKDLKASPPAPGWDGSWHIEK
ncbi:adenylate/guanylate cyclase domain-containing protein [Bradyrhizobium quebecense]|uniref:Adenylate/guanylate cyclase domain-containing protein n=2 Tax=Bradyrhizobium quebecense TaxID=2748629 RepID=A0ACD3VHT2_9BRAD|nr:adenylate/guanylate cyclase domain-containing protein [Bradyrhizobium quebecense]UGY05944.1 adenylate/guanylate cyclase domain-containing protein [Bradyrhizobium quebecense]